jgi:hypothetical protein
MVEMVVQSAAADAKLRVRFKEVTASRGKVVRAEPIAALYEQGKVRHVGSFPALEDQLVAFTTHGFMGDGSPDRADASIWGLSELFPRVLASNRGDRQSTRPWQPKPPSSYIDENARTPRERHRAIMEGRRTGGHRQPRARPQERGIWAKPGWK